VGPFRISVDPRVSAVRPLLVVALLHATCGPVLARESAVVELASAVPANASAEDSGRLIEGAEGVIIAAAIGQVRIDRAATEGRKVYADRSNVAGSALSVLFSSKSPPAMPRILDMGRLRAPLVSSVMTSQFGARRAQGGGGTRRHAGVDLAAPIGSPVSAASGGHVSTAGWSGNYGLLVVVDHEGGLQTRYAHLSRISVMPGQRVLEGQLLGLVGSTGRSTGPHLHYELRQNGRAVNPIK
jgi:murein DD-endopeptidase MepM/ murein hydrolase activator NlpD